jgi:hypothetical protein
MMKLQCIGCREEKEFAVYDPLPVCDSCAEWETKRREEMNEQERKEHTCSLCGHTGPAIDKHHIHGRKVSNETILVCANCHREIHAGVRQL